MPETLTLCPLCGDDKHSAFDRRTVSGREITNQICNKCGLVFQSPRMTALECTEFYAGEFRTNNGPTDSRLAFQRAKAKSIISIARKNVTSIASALDIGSSAGVLLGELQTQFGCKVAGVEPDPTDREYANRNGIATAASIDDITDTFDFISMSHVLEHISDPLAYLARLKRMLNPNGWLLLEVPNVYCHDSFEVGHLFAFSPRTLRQTLERAGFGAAHMETHGRPRSRVQPLYLTALAGMATGDFVFAPDRHVPLKRSVGVFYRRVTGLLSA